MFGSLGGPELIAILVLALILFGPRRIPEISRTIAKGLNEFRRATHDFKSSLEREVDMEEIRKVKREVADTVADARSLAGGRLTDPPVARRPGPAGERTDDDPGAEASAPTDGTTGRAPAEPPGGDATGEAPGDDDGERRA